MVPGVAGPVNAVTGAYRPLLEPLDLTYPQYVVMMFLWDATLEPGD